jgi:radical SAM protein with 4Fe4S-binding SPASM domain
LGRAEGADWELTSEKFTEAGNTLNKLYKKYGKEVSVASWEDLITGEHPNVTEKENKKEFGNNCGAGHRLINITPTGDVVPCSLFSEEKFILGNILSQDLKTVLGSLMNRFFYRINNPSVTSCGVCSHFYKCKGCLIRGYSMHKQFHECLWAQQEIVDIPGKRN